VGMTRNAPCESESMRSLPGLGFGMNRGMP